MGKLTAFMARLLGVSRRDYEHYRWRLFVSAQAYKRAKDKRRRRKAGRVARLSRRANRWRRS